MILCPFCGTVPAHMSGPLLYDDRGWWCSCRCLHAAPGDETFWAFWPAGRSAADRSVRLCPGGVLELRSFENQSSPFRDPKDTRLVRTVPQDELDVLLDSFVCSEVLDS